MTIEDIIRKFYVSLQLSRREKFSGYELYSHVCCELKMTSAKVVKEQSVLRRLNQMRLDGRVNYSADHTGLTYILK